MSVICSCSLAGTRACLTCGNAMSGVGDRYPAPYGKQDMYVWSGWRLQEEIETITAIVEEQVAAV